MEVGGPAAAASGLAGRRRDADQGARGSPVWPAWICQRTNCSAGSADRSTRAGSEPPKRSGICAIARAGTCPGQEDKSRVGRAPCFSTRRQLSSQSACASAPPQSIQARSRALAKAQCDCPAKRQAARMIQQSFRSSNPMRGTIHANRVRSMARHGGSARVRPEPTRRSRGGR